MTRSDTLTSIATNLAAALNADSDLQGIGVSATSSSTVVSLKSTSPNLTTFAQSLSAGATETIALSSSTSVVQSTCNNVNELISIAPGGKTRFQGSTSKPVASASVSSQIVTLSQKALKGVQLSTSVDGTPTETLTLGTNLDGNITATVGGTVTAGDVLSITVNDPRFRYGPVTCSYTAKSGDTTGTIAQGLSNAIYNTLGYGGTLYTSIALYFPSYAGSVVTINPNNYYADVIYSKSVTGVATETVTSSANLNGNCTITVGGSATTGDIVSLTVVNSNLSGGEETVSYTVTGGNTPTNIATGLKNAINASSNLTAIGVTATSSAAVVTVATEGTTYTTSLSGGATETLTLGTNANGNTTLVVGGKATNGDTVTVVTHNPLLPGGQESVGYTVGASDTLVDVAAGLVSNMNGNSDLQTLGVTAKNSCTADLAFSQSFSGNGNLPSGESLAKVSATDAVPTTKTDTNSLNVTASASATLTWDANGNMTSDGTNSYKWDAENRLIEVDYPGVNNYSLFSYDGLWRNSTLIEVVSGSMASTKQFIWNSTIRCEERDGSGSVASRYFGRGQTISASAYYYASDNLGSVRELTNSSGIIEAQYLYGPYGERSKLAGSSESTFQFGGFYAHLRSDKYLAVLRAYSSKDGRWISRDPMGGETLSKLGASGLAETNTGPSLYAYVKNGPLDSVDPIGLELHKCCENPAPMPPKGDQSPCEKYGSELYAGLLESCFCRCMGDGDWANKFRGCLACEKAQGAGVHQRHVDCGKAFPPPGPVEVATLGLCTLKCIAVTSPLVQPMSGPTTFLGAGKGASSSAGAGI